MQQWLPDSRDRLERLSVFQNQSFQVIQRATSWAIKLILLFLIGGGIGSIAFALIPPEAASELITQGSDWQRLSPEEQLALAPLAEKWASLNSLQRDKWRSTARKFSHLSQRQKDRFHRRLVRWSEVTSVQKNIARSNYKAFKTKPVQDKMKALATWKARSKSGEAVATLEPKHADQSMAPQETVTEQ
uniref:Transmembrane protein n=1 Tax=Dechloromonas aromatica (strain RCB) TaxID=159087 RepID=Q47BX4_DECAR